MEVLMEVVKLVMQVNEWNLWYLFPTYFGIFLQLHSFFQSSAAFRFHVSNAFFSGSPLFVRRNCGNPLHLFAAISGTPLMYVAICDVTSMLRSAVIRYFSGANRFFVVAQVCNGSASSSESGSCTAAASGTCWLTNSCCNLANAVCRNLRSS